MRSTPSLPPATRVFPGFTVVGHRGNGRECDPAGNWQNTPGSFAAAIDAGASWLEVDARVTADGALVLWHDRLLAGRMVGEHTVASAVAAGAFPLEVLDALPARVGVNVEVKADLTDLTGPGTAPVALAWIGQRLTTRRWLVSSFDPGVAAATVAAQVPFGLLALETGPLYESVASAHHLGAQVVVAHASVLEETCSDYPTVSETIAAAHGAGMQVMLWHVQPDQMAQARFVGADALCVDDVPSAVRVAALPPTMFANTACV